MRAAVLYQRQGFGKSIIVGRESDVRQSTVFLKFIFFLSLCLYVRVYIILCIAPSFFKTYILLVHFSPSIQDVVVPLQSTPDAEDVVEPVKSTPDTGDVVVPGV